MKVSIYRKNKVNFPEGKFVEYEVPFEQGMTILDILVYVQKTLDATLAFRYECRQGICGTCGVMLNGKPVLSCQTQIESNIENIIEPLANFPVERDLIVDLKSVLEKFAGIKPYLEKTDRPIKTKQEADASKPFRKCIECGCCIAGRKLRTKNQEPRTLLDPMDLVKLARYVTDPRDAIDRIKIARENGVEYYTVEEGRELTRLCPRNIPIDEAIKILKEN
ncbi:MAG: fumarate reductase iron-sulfur subunit [Candidatus Gottesmanbacteria bacterium GW2011_GWC2_39_8]|uniref:Fumarate reductase iron-sulfur subunit n=1 Tax=Candidatus Gottesmanbacteria bacterium GW2011_GWC2_39_8 TaxID=1618450 RepID=A0A0G0T827_9BACT|nr:MAG: fumarate reductase iron-sulfur subunit [Candidatus Gottesmanbacteria bacterium GW2011_GWC2_39_8]